MTKKDVLEILRQMGLAPNKRYGQNFLVDAAVAARIVEAAACEGQTVLEIGPGLGSLTEHLVGKASVLTAVEIDSGFCRYLGDRFGSAINLIHGDYLRIETPDAFCVAANLPYYCSSEIIFSIAQKTGTQRAVVMVQREMAQRLLARPGTDAYGAPAVSLWLDMSAELLFDISPAAFYPSPDVVSSVMRLTRVSRTISSKVRSDFHLIVKAGFWARRKQLFACLTTSPFYTIEKSKAASLLEHLGRDARVRAEELSPEEFLRASHFLNGEQ